ncbi:hypothetical protein RMN57_18805 [Kitasatospora sp. CM 4170]|uniref:Uncharacterized protein n=1 Tax=Kitasatospora aburaviensis TaxID=67265 RepID=A0ABW1F9Z1_9ACTN|nr:hypothetical protein [Kitasatospora sp. CM 4170]WNM46608.1 hypothetical protein RMN57_18805 [Kitasatospora sp. CM 4170]
MNEVHLPHINVEAEGAHDKRTLHASYRLDRGVDQEHGRRGRCRKADL